MAADMKRFLARKIILVLALGVTLSAAAAGAGETMPPPRAKVLLDPVGDRIEATFQFDKPQTEVFLASQQTFQRLAREAGYSWGVLSPDISISDGRIASTNGKPFRVVKVVIPPYRGDLDRLYPPLTPVGAGSSILYSPYLLIEGMATEIFCRPSNTVVAKGSFGRPQEDGLQRCDGKISLPNNGYLFLGHRSAFESGRVVFFISAEVPSWLHARLTNELGAVTSFYQDHLTVAMTGTPRVAATFEPAPSAAWHGDTTPGLMMSLRFRGDDWRVESPIRESQLFHFIAHETFHYWNSSIVMTSAQAWLTEGSAEYAALLASRDSGRLAEADFIVEINRRLTSCVSTLDDKALEDPEGSIGPAPYSCGVFIQWLEDDLAKRKSASRRTFYETWREIVLDEGSKARGSYQGEDYFKAAAPEGLMPAESQILDLILAQRGKRRWSQLGSYLHSLGIETAASAPDKTALKGQVVNFLLSQNCSGSYGFWSLEDGTVKLDSGTTCGVLGGNPEVISVAGRSLASDIQGVYEAVKSACLPSGKINVGTKDNREIEARCAQPIEDVMTVPSILSE